MPTIPSDYEETSDVVQFNEKTPFEMTHEQDHSVEVDPLSHRN